MNKLIPLILVAITVAVGGAVLVNRPNNAITMNDLTTPIADEAIELAPDITLGDENAPITFVEYASFTCPHCATFHENTFKKLKANYIDTGKVYFMHREVYFDRFGLWAGMVARCGGDMRYYGLIDLIYSGQNDWIGNGQEDEILANLRKIGKVAGLNDEQLDTCLADKNMAQSMIAAYQKHAGDAGVTGTPSFTINGTLYKNMSYADLTEILDEILASN